VSLAAGAGITGLLGPNGAGKSTLMRVVATLQRPDAGSVRLDDGDGVLDVLADPQAARARLGYLPQDFGLWPTLTAEATLDHFARLEGYADRAARRHAVDALLARVNLAAHARRAVGASAAGCASDSVWRSRCSARPRCWCSTSRPPAWTRPSATGCTTCSPTSVPARWCCSRHTSSRTCASCARTWRSSTRARSWPRARPTRS
jgi:hypothetical protein